MGDNWPATWPSGVRLQLHILDGDEDYEIAQRLAATVPAAELFVYRGSHTQTDPTLKSAYAAASAATPPA